MNANVSIRNISIQFDTNQPEDKIVLPLVFHYLDNINNYLADMGIQPQLFFEHIDTGDITITKIDE